MQTKNLCEVNVSQDTTKLFNSVRLHSTYVHSLHVNQMMFLKIIQKISWNEGRHMAIRVKSVEVCQIIKRSMSLSGRISMTKWWTSGLRGYP